MNRREFIKHSSLAAAAATLVPKAFGQAAANDKVTVGVLGSGARAQELMALSMGLPGVEIIAVCDAYQGRAEWNPGPYYWHGNEPDIHAAYLFNAAGRPDLTQKWVRWILDTRYSDDYVGLDGNDDGGTLSAWYVFSALGFYPIAGTPRYELGAPLFERADVDMGGPILTIIAENYAPENIYVESVTLNDGPLERTWFTHDEIAQGGTLRFRMKRTSP